MSTSSARPKTKLWLDVDTGIDDSFALLYAAASPEAELIGVSCVAGNVPVEEVTVNTAAVLDLAGLNRVEVARGADRPIERPLVTTPETHGPSGTGYSILKAPPGRISERDGVDLIVEKVRNHPGELTLVAVGPLTNIALALDQEPDLLEMLGRLVIMGGCFTVTGNTAPRAEWNIHVDPEAARKVMAAAGKGTRNLPLFVPLDVTEQVLLRPDHVARIAESAGRPLRSAQPLHADEGNPLLDFMADALRFYMEFHFGYDGIYGAFMHDPFAVAAALDPTLVETVETTVDVETKGELTTAETVADLRNAWGRPPNAAIALQGRTDLFLDRFVTRLGALARADLL